MVRGYVTKRIITAFGVAALLMFLVILTLTAEPKTVRAEGNVFSAIIDIDPPSGSNAEEPSLFALEDGRIVMSWTEALDDGFAVKVATRNGDDWSAPQTVVASESLFVNWADFPSVAAFDDGTLAAHWLQETGDSYDYDLKIALSQDEGETWGKALTPHRDGQSVQHGFASLLPMSDNKMLAVWLDGRAYGGDEVIDKMQLRGTVIAADGTLREDALLDVSTCSCCQTSAAITGDGTALVAYRDRTEGEIRDISLVRLVDGVWSDPVVVHKDGWEISGCPVNGPAIDTKKTSAVVAWFTQAGDIPAVKVAFSSDAGRSFEKAIRIDQGKATGRVDTILLGDGSALISWVEWTGSAEVLMVCIAQPGKGCSARQAITLNKAGGSMNFPRMVQTRDGVYIAWTQPGRETTIRMVLAKQ